ncbi:hypothetical protein H072_8543 [Dactylellina haptotyla CBS 200.50]|uniref:Major facilitator superfamily (MFS) profile domain-containing protein n=1 Tax=Dactylellina haptotyla (strain CBS 200.50) TaxID=1284197 RepID=S8A4L0_DACHA|nr:hypothetical protein H072_8543 [Dactylellina haptotyla CBS 200.50]
MESLEMNTSIMPSNAELESLEPVEATEAGSSPPVDGGRDAWVVLAGCTIMEALIWGFPFAFGVFQEHYTRQEQFAEAKHQVASIGTTATVSSNKV